MADMTVRNLPDDVHRRVKFDAAQRGIGVEAAARQLLDEATRPAERLGDILLARAKRMNSDFPDVERSSEPMRAADYS